MASDDTPAEAPSRAIDPRTYNRDAWDNLVAEGCAWTIPVGPEQIAAARCGELSLLLTNRKPVPASWLPPLGDCDVLCLAGGGGQQAPLLAAAGARVTVLDCSPRQLAQDRLVAERESLALATVEGDMRDLSCFGDARFDLVVHPVSNNFIDDIRPVWRECHRVLRRGGILLAGFASPIAFCFDPELEERGVLQVRYGAAYSDLACLDDDRLRRRIARKRPLCYGHSLEAQIGGQLEAGFVLTGYLDDLNKEGDVLARYLPGYAATRALKP